MRTRLPVGNRANARLAALFTCGLGAMALAPAVATALAVSEARLDVLRLFSITDPIIWWHAAASLLSSSRMEPPAYITLLGLVPHVLYLAGLVILASSLAALARSRGRTWSPFAVGALAATVSVLTAAPSWFWGITGLFFSVPPAIVEVLVMGFLCSRVAPMVYRSLMRPTSREEAWDHPDRRSGMRRLFQDSITQALLIPVGAAILGGFYLAFMALRAGDSMHFDVTPLSTAFALTAGLAIAAGITVVLRLREGSVGARFAVAVGTLVFAVLAMFSIGLLILPIALLLLGFAARQLLRRRSGRAVRAAVAGALIGVGAVAYLLVLNQPAVAECRINGSATSSGGLFGSTGLSSGGYSTPSGESGGYIDEGDRIAYFSCRDGKLTDFHRELLPQGQWIVTTQPSATVGRSVMVVFRLRPLAGVEVAIPTDGFDFSATCRTCPEPRPVVRGHVVLAGPRGPRAPGDSVTFSGPVTFPAPGSWFTSPYDAPIEVR